MMRQIHPKGMMAKHPFGINAQSKLEVALMRLEGWLETMRGTDGYGGPVAHWWQQSLMYTGVGLDWRYEGIIAGYLQLWKRTHHRRWLEKACRAGDDLLAGQLESAHYVASGFEINPCTAGTPHEAACDVGLLLLAQALRQERDPKWERYAACAERNLQAFYIEQLWDGVAQSFRDDPRTPTFVPNKAATACEAFFLLAEIHQDARWVEQYVLPTLNRIIEHQVRDGGRLDGAIAQNSFGSRKIEKYIPIYIARCVPALLQGYHWTKQEQYLACALQAMQFITRWAYEDGSLPTVVYANQQVNRYPSWVAALGDVLRAAQALQPYGFDADLSAVQERLLAGQDTSGGIQTATGFAAQAGGKVPSLPDLRDVLHVVGWCDKAFRYLASLGTISLGQAESKEVFVKTETAFETACVFQGERMYMQETSNLLKVTAGHEIRYCWRKGETWPEVATQEFWLR